MDAIQMIREDHRRVETLFRDFEEAPDAQTKKAVFDNIFMELDVHANIEEEIFYPAVQRQGEKEMIRHAEEEHGMVKQLLNEIVAMDPKDPSFEAKFHVLKDNVQDHFAEEESEMLPKAAEAGMSRLMQLGEEMERRKQQLMTATNGRRRTAASPRRRATTTRRRPPLAPRRAAQRARRLCARSRARKHHRHARRRRAGHPPRPLARERRRADLGQRPAAHARPRERGRRRPAGARATSRQGAAAVAARAEAARVLTGYNSKREHDQPKEELNRWVRGSIDLSAQ